MSVTGLVYAVLLAPNLADVAVPEPWIDWTIHVFAPILVILDWFFFPPPRSLRPSVFWIWLTFPAAYLIYTWVRGPFADWYPYPFLDPRVSDGYLEVAMWTAVVLAVILGFSALYYWWAGRVEPEKAT
jgi:hypothetical protein